MLKVQIFGGFVIPKQHVEKKTKTNPSQVCHYINLMSTICTIGAVAESAVCSGLAVWTCHERELCASAGDGEFLLADCSVVDESCD